MKERTEGAMTERKLAAVNRKTRILALVKQGVPDKDIAERERCSMQWVSAVAIGAGRNARRRRALVEVPRGV